MPLTFCVIDDEREVCDMLRLLFESRGHRCVVAHDGKSGLELAEKVRPAAVFLDVQMPRMNGYEVLAGLKKNPATAQIPVLMMTALTRQSDRTPDEWAKSVGADAFLSKPFEMEELFRGVERLTGVKI